MEEYKPIPFNVCFCSAHEDEELVTQARKHLGLLQRQGLIRVEPKTLAGGEWANEHAAFLDSTDIALLFMSPDFLCSDSCYEEATRVLQRFVDGTIYAFVLLLRPADWRDSSFRHIPVLPKNQKPISLWEDKDEAFTEIVEQVRQLITRQNPDHSFVEAETQKVFVSDNVYKKYRKLENNSLTGEEREQEKTFPRSDYYEYISLPPNYVERKDILTTVREAILGDDTTIAFFSTSQSPRSNVFHGMGGVGKTVMARALCDDRRVQMAFSHGILWVTLGQQPDLVTLLREWITVLGGKIHEHVSTINTLKNTLASLLKDRSCLLILDNVWQQEHLETFRVGGPKCRLLLTTRDARIAHALGTTIQSIPVMQEDEAVALLEEWMTGQNQGATRAIKRQIVKRLGYLPLAVKLAGTLLRNQSLSNFLRDFELRRLDTKYTIPGNVEICQTFELSLQALSEKERLLFISLAIFREGEDIPCQTIERFWHHYAGLDKLATEALLVELQMRALLERDQRENGQVVRVHDLLHEFCLAKLGNTYITLQRRFLEYYRAKCHGNGWHTADDDGYIYDHLVYHLDEAELYDEQKSLFLDHFWLHARVIQKEYTYDGYIEDLLFVWRKAASCALRQLQMKLVPLSLGDCVRYALIRTSINSAAANYVPEIVAQAVAIDFWPVQRALGVATKIADPQKRARISLALLKTGKFNQKQLQVLQINAFQAALTLSEDDCIKVLQSLFPLLMEGTLHELLTNKLLSFSPKLYRRIIGTIAPFLPTERVEKLLISFYNSSHSERISSFIELTPSLSKSLIEEAFETAIVLPNDTCINTLIALHPYMDKFHKDRVNSIINRFNPYEQLRLLETFEPSLADQNLWSIFGTLEPLAEWQRADVLIKLAPYLKGDLAERAFFIALSLLTWDCAKILVLLAPHLPKALIEQAFEIALTFPQHECSNVVTALIPWMNSELREHTFSLMQPFSSSAHLIQFLEEFAPFLSKSLLRQVIESIRGLPFGMYASMLRIIAPWLTDDLLEEGVKLALPLPEQEKTEILIAMAPHMTKELLDIVLSVEPEKSNPWILKGLPLPLEKRVLYKAGTLDQQPSLEARAVWSRQVFPSQDALEKKPMWGGKGTINASSDLSGKARKQKRREGVNSFIELSTSNLLLVLSACLPFSKKKLQIRETSVAWTPTRTLSNVSQSELMSSFPLKDFQVFLDALEEINAPQIAKETCRMLLTNSQWTDKHFLNEDFVSVLLALIPRLPKELLAVILDMALLLPEQDCSRVLIDLVCRCPEGLATPATEAILRFSEQEYVRLLRIFVPVLNRTGVELIFNKILELSDTRLVVGVVELAPKLKEPLVSYALKVALSLQNRESAKIIVALAPHLSQSPLSETILERAVETCQHWPADEASQVLTALVSSLSEGLVKKAFAILLTFPDREREKSLLTFFPYLPSDLAWRAFNNLYFSAGQRRAELLATLIRHLPDELVKQLFATLQSLPEAEHTRMLSAMLPRFSREMFIQELELSLIHLQEGHEKLFLTLAPYLRVLDDLLPKVFMAVLHNPAPSLSYSDILMALAPIEKLIELLHDYSPKLTGSSLERALEMVFAFKLDDKKEQMRKLSKDARHVQLTQEELLPEELLERAQGQPSLEAQQARALFEITSRAHLTGELWKKAFQVALTLPPLVGMEQILLTLAPKEKHVVVLTALAPHLTERALEHSFEMVRDFSMEEQITLLIGLAPYLKADLLSRAFQTALTFPKQGCVQVLDALLPRERQPAMILTLASGLTGTALEMALEVTLDFPDTVCADILKVLYPSLSEKLFTRTISAIFAKPVKEATRLLIVLAPCLSSAFLRKAIERALELPLWDDVKTLLLQAPAGKRVNVLISLIPDLTEEYVKPMLKIILVLPNQELSAIVKGLLSQLKGEARLPLLEAVVHLSKKERSEILAHLIPQLDNEHQQILFHLSKALPADEMFQMHMQLAPYLANQVAIREEMTKSAIEALFSLQTLARQDFLLQNILQGLRSLTKFFPQIDQAIAWCEQEIPRDWTLY